MQTFGVILIGSCALAVGTCVTTHPQFEPGESRTARALHMEAQPGQPPFRLSDDSEVRLSGSATVGSWDSASRQVEAVFAPGLTLAQITAMVDRLKLAIANGEEPAEVALTANPTHPPAVVLQVPITSLRSGNAKMEQDMHEALKASAHPHITYELQEIEAITWHAGQRRPKPVFEMATVGEISLAGVERPLQMTVQIEPLGGNRFSVKGRRQFDMKDFNIEPPSAMFGLIRARQRVEVVFDLVVETAVE